MTRKYYEVGIIHTGSSDGERFSQFHDEIKIFETAHEVTEWLKKEYDFEIQRTVMYHADNMPCGYVFAFENADLSHVPVERWQQKDWVNISRISAEDAFEEIEYEVS